MIFNRTRFPCQRGLQRFESGVEYVGMSFRGQSVHRGARGFTLPELLIVIGLVGIITSIAIPSFKDFKERSSFETGVDRLIRSLALARNQSLTELTRFPNSRIVVCPSSNSMADTPVCDAGGATDYSVGWLTFIDCNNNGTYQASGILCDTNGDGALNAADDDTEALLETQPPMNDLVELESATTDRVRFTRFGQADNSMDFTFAKGTTTYADIAMNAIGRIQVDKNESFYD